MGFGGFWSKPPNPFLSVLRQTAGRSVPTPEPPPPTANARVAAHGSHTEGRMGARQALPNLRDTRPLDTRRQPNRERHQK
jgi:hypothetical protein